MTSSNAGHGVMLMYVVRSASSSLVLCLALIFGMRPIMLLPLQSFNHLASTWEISLPTKAAGLAYTLVSLATG